METMKVPAHFKGSNLKETSEGNVYVLTFEVNKPRVTGEDVEAMHVMQSTLVDLTISSPQLSFGADPDDLQVEISSGGRTVKTTAAKLDAMAKG